MFCPCFCFFVFLNISITLFAPAVHESDEAGHGHEDGEHGRKPRHETRHTARHAARHGRTG